MGAGLLLAAALTAPPAAATFPGRNGALGVLTLQRKAEAGVDAAFIALCETVAELLGPMLAEKLAGHLIREIMVRGSGGGPLAQLADQLNHDVTHLQGQRLEGMLAQLAGQVTALAQAGSGPEVPRKPVRLPPRPAPRQGLRRARNRAKRSGSAR